MWTSFDRFVHIENNDIQEKVWPKLPFSAACKYLQKAKREFLEKHSRLRNLHLSAARKFTMFEVER